MKKKFMEICRNKATAAKKELSGEDIAFLETIAEGMESAIMEDSAQRNQQLTELANRVGVIDEGKTFSEIIRNMAAKLDEMDAKAKRGFSPNQKYQLKRMLEEKREVITSAERNKNDWSIEFRAKRTSSAMMQTSTIISGAVAIDNPNLEDDLEIIFIEYPKNFILDAIDSRQVTKVPYSKRIRKETTAGTGVPTVVTEGNTKPLVDKKFLYEYFYRSKYAGRVEYTEELEMDFEQLVLDVIAMFENDVITAWQDAVLAAILAWAPAYTSTVLDGTIVNPTVYSCIGAGKLCIQDKNYEPDIVIMNPGDAAEAIYIQDLNGNQQFIPPTLQFGGLTPFINNKMTAGTMLIGTKRTVKEQHGSFILRNGQYGNQLIENEYTVIGEVFSILTLPSTLVNYSWCKIDIATTKAALLKQPLQ